MSGTEGGGSGARRLVWLCGVLLVLVSGWNCREVAVFDFVAMDDDINIYFNPHLGPPSAQSLNWMFTDAATMRRYVPFGWLTFASVYSFSGLSPVGYHVTSVVLHCANTLLVFLILLQLLRRFHRRAYETEWLTLAALIGAALWALHPLRAETIGWSSGLLYASSGFWALLSTLAYLRLPAAGAGRRGLWLAAAALCYLFSIVSYPMSLALPLVFVAIDVAEYRRCDPRRQVAILRLGIEKLVLLLPGVAVLAVTVLARFEPSSFWPRSPTWQEFTLVQRGAQSFAIWAHYLWKTVCPANLTPAPTWLFEIVPWSAAFVGSAIGVIGLTVLLAVWRSGKNTLLLWVAYLALLGPLLGFTEHPHFPGDRYAYLAGVVISAAVALGLLLVPGKARVAWASVLLLASLGCSVMQRQQLRIWSDMDALMTRMIERSTELDFTVDNYRKWALFHANRGQIDRADEILAHAMRTAPKNARLLALVAELRVIRERQSGTNGRAAPPPAAALHEKFALDFSRAGRPREAHDHFRAASELAPHSASLAFNWGVWSALSGEPLQALHLYHRATNGAGASEVGGAARVRLLGLIAESFFEAGEHVMAAHAIEEALRVSEPGETPERTAALRTQLQRYRMTRAPKAAR
ncbi:MAG: hypothetical protein ABIQ12_15620 [Opitutaceae bacterium]